MAFRTRKVDDFFLRDSNRVQVHGPRRYDLSFIVELFGAVGLLTGKLLAHAVTPFFSYGQFRTSE